jgi:TRAP transporter TAXI family solute receptor
MRVIVALCLAMAACSGSAETTTPTYTLKLARTTSNELSGALKRLPNVKAQIVSNGGSSITSLVELRDGKTDIANPIADVAYLAYAGQLEEINKPFDQLRGMAVTGFNAIHLVVAPKSHVRALDELTGLHVSLGPPGSSVALVTSRLLQAQGDQSKGVRAERFTNAEMLKLLVNNRIDAAFAMYGAGSQTITAALKAGGRLIDIDGPTVEQLRTEYPYLKRTLIPAGTYPNQPEAVRTIGIDVAMVCRADLDEDLVYSLLNAYFAAMPPGTPPDLDRAPATPVPLHAGAARYYRQRELSR